MTDTQVEGTSYASREIERFQSAAYLDAGHPSIQQDNRWGDVKFYQAIRVNPGNARVAVGMDREFIAS